VDKTQAITAAVVGQLAAARVERGWSLERLATAADVHRTTVGLIERGLRSPSLAVTLRLSRALGLELAELVAQAEAKHLPRVDT